MAKNAWLAVRLVRNFPRFILNRIGVLREAETVYSLRQGLRIKLRNRTTDFLILREIFGSHDYFREGFTIPRCGNVLEIGAQIGVFTLLAAAMAADGKVLAFEPHPDNFRLLSENIALNDLSRVIARRAAVAGRRGEMTLYESRENTGGHSLLPRPDAVSHVVQAVTLADAVAEFGSVVVDFLKMDCEGAEHEILEVADEDTLSRIRCIVMEAHGTSRASIADVRSLLEKKGYDVFESASGLAAEVGAGDVPVRLLFAQRPDIT